MNEVHPRVTALLELWQMKRIAGEIPRRRDLNVFALKPWLGYLTIFEEIGSGEDYIVRLDGQTVVELTGVEWTGCRVSQLDYADKHQLLKVLRSVQASRETLTDFYQFPRDGKLIVFSRALLPVWQDTRGAGQIIQCLWPMSDRAGS